MECNLGSKDNDRIRRSCVRAELIREQSCCEMRFARRVLQEAITYCPNLRRLYSFAQGVKIDLVGVFLLAKDLPLPQIESHQSEAADAGFASDGTQYREQNHSVFGFQDTLLRLCRRRGSTGS